MPEVEAGTFPLLPLHQRGYSSDTLDEPVLVRTPRARRLAHLLEIHKSPFNTSLNISDRGDTLYR
jgi:hypothetical protein